MINSNHTCRKLPSKAVVKRYEIDRRTLGRWMADERLGFPKPVTINGRHYFDEAELDAFDTECAKRQAQTKICPAHLHHHAEVE
jgi:predicted DNA-binding transcriptional regulator AlpA